MSALNSGASVFMADLEASPSPTWSNIVSGHQALKDAAHRELRFKTEAGEIREPNVDAATLTVRPRGCIFQNPVCRVDGEPVRFIAFYVRPCWP